MCKLHIIVLGIHDINGYPKLSKFCNEESFWTLFHPKHLRVGGYLL